MFIIMAMGSMNTENLGKAIFQIVGVRPCYLFSILCMVNLPKSIGDTLFKCREIPRLKCNMKYSVH